MGAKTQINVTRKGKIADILIFFAVKMHGTTYIPTEDEELPNGDFVSKFKVSMEEAGDIYIKITYTEGEAKLVYADPTTGISDIEAAQQDGKVFSLFIKLFHLFILSFQEKSVPLSTNQ